MSTLWQGNIGELAIWLRAAVNLPRHETELGELPEVSMRDGRNGS